MAITLADFNKIWASTSPLTPYSFSEANYKQGWNFIGATPPARQMWDFLQKNNDEKMKYLANNYLPLSGGTMSGQITFGYAGYYLARSVNNGSISMFGGTSATGGASVYLFGKDESRAGQFWLTAWNGTTQGKLVGEADGTLVWNGQPIQTSSDKRLKQDFADVPAYVLEAWGKVEWKQFKYKDDVKRKGDSCRFHTGLVAQDVKEVGEENHVDLLKYGILCHDVQEAVEEEKDENGNVIQESSEAVDLWTVRYEEALAMEVIYLRNEIKKLREEIKALRTE